jgi:dipeptidyl aminopeptidase/acylaminoacyl peptidase
MPEVAPHGSWKSPIGSDAVVAGAVHFSSLIVDGADLYWTEGRPQEGGRTTIVRRTPGGRVEDVLPRAFNARSRVHEYGGGAVAAANGALYFSNFADQRLYRIRPGQDPIPVTPALDLRYADAQIDKTRRLLFSVREDHRGTGEVVNSLVVMPGEGDAEGGRVIASGHDFYSSPRLSPDGSMLAWVSWDHPEMPWDGTELWVAHVKDDGSLEDRLLVAGSRSESVMQPQWSPTGDLCFISDRTGYWNLYRAQGTSQLRGPARLSVEALCPMEAEVGGPAWVFGMSHYAFVSAERIVFAYTRQGFWRLAILDIGGAPRDVGQPFTRINSVVSAAGSVFLIAEEAAEPECIVRLDFSGASPGQEIIARSSSPRIDPGYLSLPEDVEFPTEAGRSSHGFFYAARNKDFAAPQGELPPLLVMSHGGPTSQTSGSFDLSIQYWTSRGIAVFDVNYGGSTGYGREYRNRLKGAWGIVDVDDCVNGARHLCRQGRVDPDRCMIRGGSAGGFTTLAALTFRSWFKAGACYYGIGDLETLARDTHKFESRYLDGLVGPYPAAREVYRERSPANFTERLSAPLIVFQGLEDKVVSPSQAVTMFEALRGKGIPVAYVPFEDEGHGFRAAKNIKRALEAELYFYSRVFGFPLADAVDKVTIENM